MTTAAALLTGSTLIFFIGLEAGLRNFAPQITEVHPNGLWQLSPTRGYRTVPSFAGRHVYNDFQVEVTISEQGLRDRLYGPKTPNTFRILTLGDSFTFGFGVEADEAYPKRVEALLRQTSSTRAFEVINAGMPGYSTNQELVFLEEEGLAFQPDLVLIGFYGFNDFRDNLLPVNRFTVQYGYLYEGDAYSKAQGGGLPIPWKGYLWAHFHAYRFLSQRYRMLAGRLFPAPAATPPPAAAPLTGAVAQGAPAPVHEVDEEKFTATARLIQTIADTGRRHGAGVALIIIPDYKDAQNAVSVWAPDWERITAFCAERGIPVINLNGLFREAHRAGRTPELWYPVNKHWTAAGHRLAAEAIYTALVENRWVPVEGR